MFTDRDLVIIGAADSNSDNDNNKSNNVPLTIHLMGNKVLEWKKIFVAQMKCLEH